MATDKEIENAVNDERDRCIKLLEFYQHEFKDSILMHVWIRCRNQIAMGTDPAKADFRSQMLDDEDD